MSSQQKLRAYLLSASISQKLITEFEKEFEQMVTYVIGISSKSEKVFQGTNTLEQEHISESIIVVSAINSDIEPNLRLMCLKVIRKVIEL